MVLCVRNDLKMGKGKVAAQCCHASLGAIREINSVNHKDQYVEWVKDPERKIITLKIDNEKILRDLELKAKQLDINCYIQVDAGMTQVAPNTATVIALGPEQDMILNPITSHFKLY